MNILFIGPSGSGKGTQSEKLIFKYKMTHLSTGDLFRRHTQKQTDLGKSVIFYTNKGELVPDHITNKMVDDFLNTTCHDESILFDGFPRNLNQAKELASMLKTYSRRLDQVYFFNISVDLLIDRLKGRLWAPVSGKLYHIKTKAPKRIGLCDVSGETLITRADDTEKSIKMRLEIFQKETQPLLEYYDNQNILIQIQAQQEPDQVFDQIDQAYKKQAN